MLDNMILHFRHGITDSDVVVEELTMSSCIPFGERGKLLGDGVEETNNDTNWSGFHVIAELINSSRIRNAVVAIKLHFFPDSKEDGGKHEDRGPVLEPVTTVHAGVKRRQFLENLLLQFAPHIGQSTLDLEVDHHGGNDLSVELGVFVLNQAIHRMFISSLFHHRDVEGQVVGKDELQCFTDDWYLLLHIIAVSGLQDISDEKGAFEVVIDEFLEGPIKMFVEVFGQCFR